MKNQTPSHQSTIGPLRWSVPSATAKGTTYEVAADTVTGELRCNCLARRVCWHIKATASGAIGKPRVRITAQTRPAPVSPIGDTPVASPSPFRAPTDGVSRGGRSWS